MARRPTIPQLDLLTWTPPAVTEAFEERRVRAATLSAKISLAVSEALKDCELSRDEIAAEMSGFLGEDVSKPMLDAYASQARDDHRVNVVRFIALISATHDKRLLELIAGMFGWSVVERKFLPLIELAALREKEDELKAQAALLRRQARQDGVL